jgi:hypothetical protein
LRALGRDREKTLRRCTDHTWHKGVLVNPTSSDRS